MNSVRRYVMALVMLGSSLLITTQTKATVLANSETDFSGTQGGNNWYYGYEATPFTSSTFQLFPHYDANFTTNEYSQYPTSFFGGPQGWYLQWGNTITGGSGGYWLSLWTNGGHPNGIGTLSNTQPVVLYAVRRWVSDVSGQITISGALASLNGGGMFASVDVDGNPVFSSQAPVNTSTYSFTTNVTVGSDVDFIITPPGSGDQTNGATEFTAVISSVPEPSTLALLGVCAVGLLGRRSSKRCGANV